MVLLSGEWDCCSTFNGLSMPRNVRLYFNVVHASDKVMIFDLIYEEEIGVREDNYTTEV